jgi:hypothetical protein
MSIRLEQIPYARCVDIFVDFTLFGTYAFLCRGEFVAFP